MLNFFGICGSSWGVAEDLLLAQQVFKEFCKAKLHTWCNKAGAQGGAKENARALNECPESGPPF
jgi:hypothetical protein